MAQHCCHSEFNCVCCNKTRQKAPWDRCLDTKDLSGNQLCTEPVNLPTNSTVQPHPSHESTKYRIAQIVKNPGNTVYGRWSRAKWNSKTKTYTILGGRR